MAWENALVKILEKKYGKVKSHLLTKEYIALTQGAIMMMNLYNLPENYLTVGKKITNLF